MNGEPSDAAYKQAGELIYQMCERIARDQADKEAA